MISLITIREAPHTTHNAKNVVVHGEDGQSLNVLICALEPELGGVNSGEVTCSGGLVFLGAKGEAVHGNGISNTGGAETRVAIPDLIAGEVFEVTSGEAIGSVQDNLGLHR